MAGCVVSEKERIGYSFWHSVEVRLLESGM
jgi:hypothetical protein